MRQTLQTKIYSGFAVLVLILGAVYGFVRSGALPEAVGLALAVLATAAAARLTSRAVARPLQEVAEAATDIAGGDLERRVRFSGSDPAGKLAQSLNELANSLRRSLVEVTEERNRMQAILDSMADGMIALDGQGRVMALNPVMEKIFGISEDGVRGKPLLQVVRDYELERLWREVLRTGEPAKQELRLLTPEPRIFSVHLTPLKGAGGGVVALLRDITERRRLERLRTEFIANASHELRTPLTSIRGFVETLLDGALEDPEVARRFLGIIGQETARLSRLVDEMLNLGRIEEHERHFRRRPVDLRSLMQRAAEVFSEQAAARGLKLTVEVSDDLPLVAGDADLLTQVLDNLLSNALKFTDRGAIHLRAWGEDGWVMIEVRDTGIGIPEDALPRIFERFYRVDRARTAARGGTGLGLAIVKHVVEGHGGRISVNSAVGKGTSFTVKLPALPPS